MICLRKNVDRLHALEAIAGGEEREHVARERGRVAGHVDDARRPERGERGKRVGGAGATWSARKVAAGRPWRAAFARAASTATPLRSMPSTLTPRRASGRLRFP